MNFVKKIQYKTPLHFMVNRCLLQSYCDRFVIPDQVGYLTMNVVFSVNIEVAQHLLKVQDNLFKNYLNFKNTMENLKLVERRGGDYAPHAGRKSDPFKMRSELCGSLGSRISNYVKGKTIRQYYFCKFKTTHLSSYLYSTITAVSSDGKNPSRSTLASVNRIKIPDAFLRDKTFSIVDKVC